jgi:C4-dicarboxylate-specific signal transduction histidine kinase
MADVIYGASNLYQLVALAMVGIFVLLSLWIRKSTARAISDSECRERSEVKRRVEERNQQLAEMNRRIDEALTIAQGVGTSFDRHIQKHDVQENELLSIRKDLHAVDKKVVEIHTIIMMIKEKIIT